MSEWKAGGKAMVDLVQGPGDAHTFHIPSSGGPYFLVSASALQPVADPPWREDDENTHKQKLEKALAVMIVSPWREIDDEARNGQLWLISGFVEDNPEKGRWVVIGRWWPEHGYWTSEEDEPEGWEPEFYPPTLYAPIPELPK